MVSGFLRKMEVNFQDPVQYTLALHEGPTIKLNPLIGKTLQLNFSLKIACVGCGRKISKSFNQGYCYPCFKRLAACDSCIIKPELCHFDNGTCREPDWGLAHCMQPHYVYVSYTSNIKVGVTRAVNIPMRWIDQGAISAQPIFSTHTRLHAGIIEHKLASFVKDKTQWQRMLKQHNEVIQLSASIEVLFNESAINEFIATNTLWEHTPPVSLWQKNEQINIAYPVEKVPEKISSHNPHKESKVEGVLTGIKGQYLIFDTGVINIRKYTGYAVDILSS